MEIKNVTQFASFISSNGLGPLDHSFSESINCINHFSAMCNCHNKQEKLNLYNTCKKIYEHAAKNVIPKFRNEIFSKVPERMISFFNEEGKILITISR